MRQYGGLLYSNIHEADSATSSCLADGSSCLTSMVADNAEAGPTPAWQAALMMMCETMTVGAGDYLKMAAIA